MHSLKIEFRNYGVEMALWDRISTHGVRYTKDIKALLYKDSQDWMSPDHAFPWNLKRNAGYVHGLVFDSNLDITVKDNHGVVLDRFKGSDCFDLTYVYREYSVVPIVLSKGCIYGGRITGMEVSKEGFQCCVMAVPSKPYSRDNLHFGLSKVTNIYTYDHNGWYIHSTNVFVLDSHFQVPRQCNLALAPPVNANTKLFTLNGPRYQEVFVSERSYLPPRKFKEANQKDCDSLYKHFISTGEFK
jgi:hypothetical protein